MSCFFLYNLFLRIDAHSTFSFYTPSLRLSYLSVQFSVPIDLFSKKCRTISAFIPRVYVWRARGLFRCIHS